MNFENRKLEGSPVGRIPDEEPTEEGPQDVHEERVGRPEELQGRRSPEEERGMKKFRIATFVTPSNGKEIMSGTNGSAPSAEDMEAEALGALRRTFPPSAGWSGHRVEIRELSEIERQRNYE